MAKKETTKNVLERTYNIPLRKEYQKVPRWKRTPKAVRAAKQFLIKHMKSENVKLGSALNEKLWQHGMKNPPHHVKVTVTKDDKGEVKAELFGIKQKEEPKKDIKKKVEAKKEEIQAKEEQLEGEKLEGASEAELEKKKKSVEAEKEEVKNLEEKEKILKSNVSGNVIEDVRRVVNKEGIFKKSVKK